MTDPTEINSLIRAAAPPVVDLYPNWTTGTDSADTSSQMEERRALWESLSDPVIIPWLEGLKFQLNPGNEMSRIIYLTGRYEPNEFWWLKRFLKPGMGVIDVGANVGCYTLYCAALVGRDGRVVAIEPSEREYRRLSNHVSLNNLVNVTALNVAASSTSGKADLKIAEEWNAGHNTLGQYAYDATKHFADETVVLKTIDDMVRETGMSRVDFIKMDIEGAELAALTGACDVLRRFRPTVLIELVDLALRHQGTSSADVFDFFEGLDYRLYRFNPHQGKLLPAPRRNEYLENLFAIPNEHAFSTGHMIVSMMRPQRDDDWRVAPGSAADMPASLTNSGLLEIYDIERQGLLDCLADAGSRDMTMLMLTADSIRRVDVNRFLADAGECGEPVEGMVRIYNGDWWRDTDGNVSRKQCRTLRDVVSRLGLSQIDVLHIDIGGNASDVILDCVGLFASGMVSYVLIRTDESTPYDMVRSLLDPYFAFRLDLAAGEGLVQTPFGLGDFSRAGLLLGKSVVARDGLSNTVRYRELPATFSLSEIFAKIMPFGHLERTVADELAQGRPLNAVRAIRRWAAQRSSICDGPLGITAEPTTLGTYLLGYEWSAFCGSDERAADFLARLFFHFGFSAACLGIGLQNLFSRHVTLVSVPLDGRDVTLIQDSYVNAEYEVAGYDPSPAVLAAAAILAPNDIRRSHHFPDDRRRLVRAGDGRADIIGDTSMLSLDQWFAADSHSVARRYLAGRIDRNESEMTPYDLFVVPFDLKLYGDSAALRRDADCYVQATSQLTRELARQGRAGLAGGTNLADFLAGL